MRLISPIFPGTVFAIGAITEVAILTQTAGGGGLPIWAQLIPMGIVLGIGTWGLLRLFHLEEKTTAKFLALEEKWAERADAQHMENQRAAAGYASEVNTKLETLNAKIDPVLFMMMGVQGKGGYLEELTKNRDRRHQLANEIQALRGDLYQLCRVVQRIGEKVGVVYDPPDPPPHRRVGDQS